MVDLVIRKNLERVFERIARAARGAGRDPSEVTLVCVTKGVPPERVKEAIACGVREIGENRVQEAQAKQEALPRYVVPNVLSVRGTELRWHLIGHLQRNKAKLAVELFDWIHSVDSLPLMEALDRLAALQPSGGGKKPVLIQVNVSAEEAKHGCSPQELRPLAEAVSRSKNLALKGLMTLTPFSEDPEDARPVFAGLRRLRDDLQRDLAAGPLGLSMGMSGDFETAVQEGATWVRVGTAIFGERPR